MIMQTLRTQGRLACRICKVSCPPTNVSRSAFSTSCARPAKFLPVYLESSTPELSALLSTFNSKILLPAQLSKAQQDLVFKPENKAKLEAEPVEITIGDVTLPLEHLDRDQLPNQGRTFREIVKASETQDDYENALRALEGTYQSRGISTKSEWKQILIRKLFESGNHHLVIKAIERPKASGIILSNYNVLYQVLRGIHEMAALRDFAKEETTQAYKLAKTVVELMENTDHHEKNGNGKYSRDLRGHPIVVALPTEMAAKLAEKHDGDKEVVGTMVNRLVLSLQQIPYTDVIDQIATKAAKTEADFATEGRFFTWLWEFTYDCITLSMIQTALKSSRTVLGADTPHANEAVEFEQKIQPVLANALQLLTSVQTRRGDRTNRFVLNTITDVEQALQG